ncbi:UDP-2,4-diacetamido-2,4,6-trideoxy-beta-L-altropyranose hydrolase [Fulvivirgaceae bacterium BMA12]|uniref:UDP-2,4-diacetamido-2,4, 6-trideoxy-beta-L-altropyranose hydrolase n=1 Tax=Agaribacillus aureus TaxID=3051825 RepID=A0ABT8LH40_9BACT|nr:UDP-2,4-diacetamido-2,4,6-trideoxy-beta-L-altropyranose hydrolase [Fulvivirgaceae bacterium BMA12]
MNSKIYLRADGNKEIGHGHISRLLALADYLKEVCNPILLTSDSSEKVVKSARQYCQEIIKIPQFENLEEEADYLTDYYLKKSDIIVLDGYQYNSSYQKTIKSSGCQLICIDDLNEYKFEADYVINPAGGIDVKAYRKRFYTNILSGPTYALLKKPFIERSKNRTKFKDNKEVLICLGGSDITNQTQHVLGVLEKHGAYKTCHVVVGSSYPYLAQLQEYIKNAAISVHLYSNLSAQEMVQVMSKSAIAVCSASTISYEYCCVGGILYLVKSADNQQGIYNYLIAANLAIPFSNISPEADYHRLVENQKKTFNGDQPLKYLNLIQELQNNTEISVRDIQENDLLVLFNWANDKEVRSNALNTESISLENHKKWFYSKINQGKSKLFIAERSKEPVGQVRFDLVNGCYVIDYSVDSKFRGKGLGKLILKKAIARLLSEKIENSTMVIIGEVRESNVKSWKVFENLNFVFVDLKEHNGVKLRVYKLTLSCDEKNNNS